MKSRIEFIRLLAFGLLMAVAYGCKTSDTVKKEPVITWAEPADITVGTVLGNAQLNATADVSGNFVYTPSAGTVLAAGQGHVLKAEFKPSDTKSFTSVTKTVKINVSHPGKSSVVFNTTKTYGTMVDQEGYIYKTIQIGTQTWMAENLRVTKYRNGEPISLITDNTVWTTTTGGAYSSNTNNDDNTATYGRYYNAYAVTDSRKIAPVGWHVPTNTEWAALVTYLGDQYSAGGKLKETGSTHWLGGNAGATNSTGFSGVPGGYRSYVNGAYQSIGSYGYFWTQTAFDATRMYAGNLLYYGSGSELVYYRNNVGHSVRLIKD